ncbi:MAG: phage major tail protein, TP901-1 family [Pseudomonadota bacterium]
MTGQRGRDVLIKISDSGTPERFTTLAGIRTTEIELNAQSVDGTAADSPNGWRELIAGAGVKTARVGGRGVFKDAESDAQMRQIFFSGQIARWQLVIPGLGSISGPLQIKDLKWSGAHDGEMEFSVALESAGELIFEAAA